MRRLQHRRPIVLLRLTLIAIAILGLGTAAVSAAGPAPASQRANDPTWIENPGLTLRVTDPASQAKAGASTGGEVFDRSDFQAMLLLPAAGDLAYVLDLKTQQVAAYARPAVLGADGNPRAVAPAGGRPVAPFDTNPEGQIHFMDGGRTLLIETAPPLLGPIAWADLVERYPGYARRAAAYRPDAAKVARLAAAKLPAEIVVFFGTWCQICRHELPALVATLDAAKNPNFKLSLVAIDENVIEPKDLISQYSVLTTPTTIVTIDGQELGRIEEEPRVSVEADLAGILLGPDEGSR
jgi:thiol-disulfide isomerase/thioredoxin